MNDLDIFYRSENEAEAHVFVRCRLPGELSGSVRGPFCRSTRTLPTTHPLRRTEDESRRTLYSAHIVDPCYWTPSLPAYYRVEMQFRNADGSIEELTTQLGIRRLVPFRHSLVLDGRRIVVRGVHRESATADELDGWHTTSSCFVADNPSAAMCREASELGVMTLARLDRAPADVARELRRLCQYPAVAIAVLSGETPDAREAAPNMLLAAAHDPTSPAPPPPWAHAVVCRASLLQQATNAQLDRVRIPIVVERRLTATTDIEAARRACDDLQRALSPRFDLAGYIV